VEFARDHHGLAVDDDGDLPATDELGTVGVELRGRRVGTHPPDPLVGPGVRASRRHGFPLRFGVGAELGT
jgi:predicted TIM-barrel fold metal-dependent hydrolase